MRIFYVSIKGYQKKFQKEEKTGLPILPAEELPEIAPDKIVGYTQLKETEKEAGRKEGDYLVLKDKTYQILPTIYEKDGVTRKERKADRYIPVGGGRFIGVLPKKKPFPLKICVTILAILLMAGVLIGGVQLLSAMQLPSVTEFVSGIVSGNSGSQKTESGASGKKPAVKTEEVAVDKETGEVDLSPEELGIPNEIFVAAEKGNSMEDIVLKNPASNCCISFAFVSVERDTVYLETGMVDSGSTTSCRLENIPEEKAAMLVIATVYDRETFSVINTVEKTVQVSRK